MIFVMENGFPFGFPLAGLGAQQLTHTGKLNPPHVVAGAGRPLAGDYF